MLPHRMVHICPSQSETQHIFGCFGREICTSRGMMPAMCTQVATGLSSVMF